jgi:hypothetical protein
MAIAAPTVPALQQGASVVNGVGAGLVPTLSPAAHICTRLQPMKEREPDPPPAHQALNHPPRAVVMSCAQVKLPLRRGRDPPVPEVQKVASDPLRPIQHLFRTIDAHFICEHATEKPEGGAG